MRRAFWLSFFLVGSVAEAVGLESTRALASDALTDGNLWRDHRAEALGLIGVIIALVTLVGALLINRDKRLRSERALAERLRFECLIAGLSAELINVRPEKVNAMVNRALRRVRKAMDVDRCALFVLLAEEGVVRLPNQAEAPGVSPYEADLPMSRAPFFFGALLRGETVEIADIERDLPPEAEADRLCAAAHEVRSILAMPITVSEELVRGVWFQTSRRRRTWAPDLVPRLRLVGEILVAAVVGKRAEAALLESERRYREVVESQTELICRWRPPDATLTFVNDAYCRYFGRSREELIGKPFLELIPEGPAREAARKHVASLIGNPRLERNEHEVLQADGTIGWQQWVDHTILGRDGRVIEFQAIGRDITDRKRAEEATRNLAHSARLAVLGELTASIAHEINQPLGAILSNADAAEMLMDAGPGKLDEVRTILSDIRREGLRASEVIRHVRTLLLKRPMESTVLGINDVIADVVRLVGGEARRRGVALETQLAPELPAVRGDRVWLEQVVVNLVLNGMDAMETAPLEERRMTVSTGGDGNGPVEVRVTDAGHGIPPPLVPRLFDSFITSKEEGVGLGLSISRSIVEAHGGRIRAENNQERGATFRFTLPAEAAVSGGSRTSGEGS